MTSAESSTASAYFFHGRILPERVHFHLNYSRDVQFADIKAKFRIFGFGSEFNGLLEAERPLESMLSLSSMLNGILRSILDRYSFANICAYDFDLIGAYALNDGAQQIFGVSEAVFFSNLDDQINFAKEKIPFLNEFLSLEFHDVRLDHAIRCFNHALRDWGLSTLFCYLAIETLARRINEIQQSKEIENVGKEEWLSFRKALRLKEETIKSDVKALSDKFRHGNFVDTSWDERKTALALTWEIISRAMHFIKTRSALPADKFEEI
jgi:hypothetical protein